MAWFKVDDGLHSSRKLMSIPKRARFAAIGTWTVAGSWAADELTDGFVPSYMLDSWGTPPSAPASLVDAGLWERTSGGYVFCNWHEYQPSKQDVDAERAASRERMRELRARRKQGKPQKDAAEQDVFGRTVTNRSESVRNPDPTRPDPTHIERDKSLSSSPAVTVDEFESVWVHWPKKTEKKKSLEKFKAKAKTRGLEQLKADIVKFGRAYAATTEKQFTPALCVWLGGERWEDDLPAATTAAINAQWDAALNETKPDPCAGGHRWAAGECIRCLTKEHGRNET